MQKGSPPGVSISKADTNHQFQHKKRRVTKWQKEPLLSKMCTAIAQVRLDGCAAQHVAEAHGRLLSGKWFMPERTLRRYLDISKDDTRKDSGFFLPLRPGERVSRELARHKEAFRKHKAGETQAQWMDKGAFPQKRKFSSARGFRTSNIAEVAKKKRASPRSRVRKAPTSQTLSERTDGRVKPRSLWGPLSPVTPSMFNATSPTEELFFVQTPAKSPHYSSCRPATPATPTVSAEEIDSLLLKVDLESEQPITLEQFGEDCNVPPPPPLIGKAHSCSSIVLDDDVASSLRQQARHLGLPAGVSPAIASPFHSARSPEESMSFSQSSLSQPTTTTCDLSQSSLSSQPATTSSWENQQRDDFFEQYNI